MKAASYSFTHAVRLKLQFVRFLRGPSIIDRRSLWEYWTTCGQKLTGPQRGYSRCLLSVPRISPRMLRSLNWLPEERKGKRKT
jgi:hypothetical protein